MQQEPETTSVQQQFNDIYKLLIEIRRRRLARDRGKNESSDLRQS